MSLSINTNIDSLIVQRNLNSSQGSLTSRWNACPRVCGSTRPPTTSPATPPTSACRARSTASCQAAQNTQEAVALVQTAQGALNDVEQMLQRMRELAVQLANGTNSKSDEEAIENEVETARKRAHSCRRND